MNLKLQEKDASALFLALDEIVNFDLYKGNLFSQDERESRIRFAGPGGTGEAKPTVTFNAPSTRLESGQRGPASSLQDRPPVGGSDPGSKKTLGVDFTRQQQQRATQGLRDIERNLPLDERPAARQKLIEELKETRRIKERKI